MAERAGEATGMGSFAGSASLASSSVAAPGGDEAAAAAVASGGARGGELVPSSTIAVALQTFPG